MRRLFIVGSRGIPAHYGGFETATEEVSTRLAAAGREVYVTCEVFPGDENNPDTYKDVNLINLPAPGNNLRTFLTDPKGLAASLEKAEAGDIIYLLGYGAGPFALPVIKKIKAKGVEFWLNPDGLEWKRSRWPWHVKKYLRFSEGLLAKRADQLVCDSQAIRHYLSQQYSIDRTRMNVIEYGASFSPLTSKASAKELTAFQRQHDLHPGAYYVTVGRFIADNNLEMIVHTVLDKRITKKLVILASYEEENPFYRHIKELIRHHDNKVILAGWPANPELSSGIQKDSFAYLHGHEVGGTNPSLLRAMGLANLIAALETPFSREVLNDCGVLFQKSPEALMDTLLKLETISHSDAELYSRKAAERVEQHYNWDRIAGLYTELIERGPADC